MMTKPISISLHVWFQAILLSMAILVQGCTAGGSGDSGSPPSAPTLTLTPQATKIFHFSWTDVADETEYKLLEDPDGVLGYSEVATIDADANSYDLVTSLPKRINARYILQACNEVGCTDSDAVYVSGTLTEVIGYFKASNTGGGDYFGYRLALSGDGNTLAVSAVSEDSSTTGINSTPDDAASGSGAVYVFVLSGSNWSQQAYIKASNTGAGDGFGSGVSLSKDGNTLAVGAPNEDSGTTGINSIPDEATTNAGAVYIFIRSGTNWSQQAYIKASNTGTSDAFGSDVSLSDDGNTLAVGAYGEASSTTGINSTPDDTASYAGAAYVFIRSGVIWGQIAYIKASNTDAGDFFGNVVAVSGDGNTLAVAARLEDSGTTGVNSIPNEAALDSGAVYVFTRSDNNWNQQAYIKAFNTDTSDVFGQTISLSSDGNTLAVGATGESSGGSGINSTPDEAAANSGAAYIFIRGDGIWGQQAFIKASNTGAGDLFGIAIALSGDGNTLAVGARNEAGSTTGVNSTPDDASVEVGAAYVFIRSDGSWAQQAYIKASNSGAGDWYGISASLSDDGNTLAVGAYQEDSSSTGVNSTPDEAAGNSGAVYLY